MTTVRTAAIDLGAGSGRVLVAEYHQEHLSLREMHRFATPRLRDPESGYECWDLDRIEAEVVRGLEAVHAQAPLHSLAVDSWGVDYVLLDRDRQRVGPAVSYRDPRTQGMVDLLSERMSTEEIYRRTGIQFMPINTLYQLAQTAQAHPEWLERARTFLMVPDWLNYRLCGVLANEYSNATTTQMFSIERDDWDRELLGLAGLSRAAMLTPVEPGTVLAEIDRPTGPVRRVAVIAAGSHDTASAVAAVPFQDPAEVFISSGTWSLVGFESRRPFTGSEARRLNFTNEGGVERRYRVLKNVIGLWPAQRLVQETGLDQAALVQAAQAASAWGALVDPADPRFLNPPSMTEAIRAACRESGQPEPKDAGELARCVFESLALSYRQVLEEIEALRGLRAPLVRIVGGGSRNRLLNQLCADACQLPVQAGPTETSAIGNALVQFIALGVFRSLAEARELVGRCWPGETFRPAGTVPESALRRFKNLVQRDFPGEPVR